MNDAETTAFYDGYPEHMAARNVIATPETPEETFRRRAKLQDYRFEALLPYIPEGSVALEIGGGCGNFIGELLHSGRLAAASLVESCTRHLDYARNRFPGLSCLTDMASQAPASHDLIIMLHVLEHIPEPRPLLAECVRLLKPGGKIIVETPASTDPLISMYNCTAYKDFYFQPMHPYVYCQSTFDHLFSAFGFSALAFEHVQRYSLSNHLIWLSKGRPGGDTTLDALLGPECQAAYRSSLRTSSLTDTIFGIFYRNPHK